MRVVILTVQAPFISGGAEYLAESLREQIQRRGAICEIVAIPFKWYPAETLLRSMIACRLLRLEAANPDVVIALKFPAYLAPWPAKRVWLLHQFRQAYELWGTPWQDLPATPEGETVRAAIINADNLYLRQSACLYTNSRIVADRLKAYNGIEADGVLFPPLADASLFRCGDFGDYFFYPSRLVASKRQHVAIEAMRYVRGSFRLVVAGAPDSAAYGEELHEAIRRFGLEDRVTLLGRISEEEKASWMADCCGVVYLPFDEDSYGYVTLEAFHSGKPVVTFTDGGGVQELVADRDNGRVVAPDARALAAALDELWDDKNRARALGASALASLDRHAISWDRVIEALLS